MGARVMRWKGKAILDLASVCKDKQGYARVFGIFLKKTEDGRLAVGEGKIV
jgi:hypothetical protein